MSAGVREYVLELVKSKYADSGPTLATEVLLANHDIQVGRETLRTWMLEDGLWQLRKQRRSFPACYSTATAGQGNTSSMQVPPPLRLLAFTMPLCSLVARWVIAKPTPKPPVATLRALSSL
jgi:hypothetical protein